MKPKWQKLASFAPGNMHTLVSVLGAVFASKGYPFENIFDFTTACDWDCMATVERLPALHYGVDIILLSFGIMGFVWNFETI